MLKVPPAPEPPTFDANVRKEGERAIKEMVGEGAARRGRPRTNFGTRDAIPSEKFTDYWTRALGDLKTAYNYICAYSCFHIHDVTGDATVDHFIPKEWRTV
ncbi:MAG: hypothetical protein NT023_09155, partial [Armatimonadetes bacterium]|nr:hypothetical protein [Armatimonadota bacterium]